MNNSITHCIIVFYFNNVTTFNSFNSIENSKKDIKHTRMIPQNYFSIPTKKETKSSHHSLKRNNSIGTVSSFYYSSRRPTPSPHLWLVRLKLKSVFPICHTHLILRHVSTPPPISFNLKNQHTYTAERWPRVKPLSSLRSDGLKSQAFSVSPGRQKPPKKKAR